MGSPIERDAELEQLAGAVTGAVDGVGACVVVTGPAGMGKTRLLREAADLGRTHGCVVLRAAGAELESEFAFGTMRTLLERAVRGLDGADRESLLDGAAAPAVAALGLDGATVVPDPSFGVLNALYWVVAGLAARQPHVLVVDDLQWVDAPSLRALAFLAGRLDDLDVTLVAAHRSETPGTDPVALAAILEGARRLPLAPLTPAGVARLAAELDAPPLDDVAARAGHALTAGNPLLAREIFTALLQDDLPLDATTLHGLTAAAPPSVRTVVITRLGRLGADARDLAGAVATLGDGVTPAVAAAFLDRPVDDVLVAAARLAGAGVLDPDRLAFVHPLVAAAVVEDRGAHLLALDHARAAEVLRGAGASPEQIASHLVRAPLGRDAAAAADLLAAGAAALAAGAPDVAIGHLERALAEGVGGPAESLGAQASLGIAQLQARRNPEAVATLEPLVEAGVPVELVVAYVVALGAAAGPQRGFKAALELATGRSPSDRAQLLAYAALVGLVVPPEHRRPVELPDPADLPDEPWALPAIAACTSAAFVAGAPREEVLDLARRAGAPALVAGAGPGMDVVATWPAFTLGALGAVTEADAVADACGAALRRNNTHMGACMIPLMDAVSALWRGQLRRAIAESDAAIRLGTSMADSFGVILVSGPTLILVLALLDAEGPEAAREALARVGVDDATALTGAQYDLRAARGAVRLAGGDVRAAVDDFATVRRDVGAWLGRTTLLDPLPLHVEALVAAGRLDEARELARADVALSRRAGGPQELSGRLRVQALAEPDRADELLDEAIALVDGTPFALHLAKALATRGRARRKAGRRGDARPDLERAVDLAMHCGAAPLAAACRDELKVLGARPRRHMFSGVESLTAAERRVCELAVDGLTNRAIAQELFVSPKTVESHLGAAYRKLDITSRADLAETLTSAPLP